MDNLKILIIGALCLLIAVVVYMIMNQKESFSSCEYDNFNSEPMDDYVRGANVDEVASAPACVVESKGDSEPGPSNLYSSSPKKILDDADDPVSGNETPVDCFPKGHLNPVDLLPSDKATAWSHANPVGKGALEDQNFLSAGYHVGINTVGQSLRNANMQIRSEPPNPTKKVGPWMQSTIEPDLNRKPLEISQE
jgi:hypothetical protein|uniref:Minor capsid protein P11 C-terminal conserved region domain-containing protein n=1 Tax=viral metagenome TaxID=1070528 RepID=A0A6C0AH03_9ZZZZ|tara:strand:- start:31978 stop:32559 length:582 start_codon:yes stop_codon:yes gene_type:complete